ncbi:hypothetical protein [Mycoplasma phocoeninasale]|uniref:hypothetical protein n=1 Tax=Mycoplasma phocoeninasale TaxID=2726117 RepID=UPI00197C2CEB|nr:hypothetical protein [Mycoplasma phocoeninasale]
MNKKNNKNIEIDTLRKKFSNYLLRNGFTESTAKTIVSDSLYLLRKEGSENFLKLLADSDFENTASSALQHCLSLHSEGAAKNNIIVYLSSLKKLRNFLNLSNYLETVKEGSKLKERLKKTNKSNVILPNPTTKEVNKYLTKWNSNENNVTQELGLDELFNKVWPNNVDLKEIMIKIAALDHFYSTNIFSAYDLAKHILKLNIDSRLQLGDATLVDDIKKVSVKNKIINFYSFASKYCNRHRPDDYPIYDSYVKKVLIWFRNQDNFSDFEEEDLKQYPKFKDVINDFINFYELNNYKLMEIDKYIWQLGKEYFSAPIKDDKNNSKN